MLQAGKTFYTAMRQHECTANLIPVWNQGKSGVAINLVSKIMNTIARKICGINHDEAFFKSIPKVTQ